MLELENSIFLEYKKFCWGGFFYFFKLGPKSASGIPITYYLRWNKFALERTSEINFVKKKDFQKILIFHMSKACQKEILT